MVMNSYVETLGQANTATMSGEMEDDARDGNHPITQAQIKARLKPRDQDKARISSI